MKRRIFHSRTAAALAVALAGALCLVLCAASLAGCRRGGQITEKLEPRIDPYRGYFQAQLGDDVYLFADLLEKLRFDREPAALTYEQYIARTGQRVFISNARPELVKRIEVAYEQAVDTELMQADAPGAPPAATPPPTTTRRIRRPSTSTGPATTPTTAATAPATAPSTVPADRLGPTGDPQTGDD